MSDSKRFAIYTIGGLLLAFLVCIAIVVCLSKIKYACLDSPVQAILTRINDNEPRIEFEFDEYNATDMYNVMDVAMDAGYTVSTIVCREPYKYQQWIPTARGAGFCITQSGVRIKKTVVLTKGR